MTEHYRITPPPSLVEQWCHEYGIEQLPTLACFIADKAAEWSSDQELEACCEWLSIASNHGLGLSFSKILPEKLRAARRPKAPSIKQQALLLLSQMEEECEMTLHASTIRRALEALPDE